MIGMDASTDGPWPGPVFPVERERERSSLREIERERVRERERGRELPLSLVIKKSISACRAQKLKAALNSELHLFVFNDL